MSNKDVAGVPYPLAKSRSKALGKNVYDHVGHRKFNPNLGSIPTCFQAPLLLLLASHFEYPHVSRTSRMRARRRRRLKMRRRPA
jgi:hypothetical protein